jgi:hypothetical protein
MTCCDPACVSVPRQAYNSAPTSQGQGVAKMSVGT